MKCRIGDLAVVIDAFHRCNLGRIVRVLAPHDGTGAIPFRGVGPVWLVESDQPLTWSVGIRRFRRKSGPVPDSSLQPIRGLTPDAEASEAIKKLFSTLASVDDLGLTRKSGTSA